MASIGTTSGEVAKVIADADRVVVDPANLTLRQIVAGQPIPPDLVDAPAGEVSIVGFEFGGGEAPAEPAKVSRSTK